MNSSLYQQLAILGLSLAIALIVRRHYKRRTFASVNRYSTFAPRFWTGTVDWCVLWPIDFVASALLSLNIPRGLAALLIVVQSLAWLLYIVLMHGWYGQTIGKMVTHVRVADFRTEGKISFRQAWLREGIPMALSLGILGYEVFAVMTGRWSPAAIAKGEAQDVGRLFALFVALPGLWFLVEVLPCSQTKRGERYTISSQERWWSGQT